MSDKENNGTHWNKGNLSDPTDVRKQAVIVIPDQGAITTEDEEIKTPRQPEQSEVKEENSHEQNDIIDREVGEKTEGQNESETINGGGQEETDEPSENVAMDTVPPNIAGTEELAYYEQKDGDSQEIQQEGQTNGVPKPQANEEQDLQNLDHTMTQSIVLDDEEEAELERVLSKRDSPAEGHKGEGQGCMICELCQAEAEQNRVPIKVDYNMVFKNGARGREKMEGNGASKEYRKAYTPTSDYTESEIRVGHIGEGKDTIFQQALSLMSERCVSRPSSKSSRGSYIRSYNRESVGNRLQNGTLGGRKPVINGLVQPQYFYINQSKPAPMEPLKAWRGYNGNVYFEPISIQTSKQVEQSPPKSPDIGKCTPELQQILMRSRRSPSLHNASIITGTTNSQTRIKSGDSIRSRRTLSRHGNNQSPSGQSIKSSQSKRSGTRQSVFLDKKTVLSRSNENIEEDILWLAGQESTGSLCVLETQPISSKKHLSQPSEEQHQQPPQISLNRDRIRKGSVVRQMKARHLKGHRPMLSVSGDRFTEIPKPSPIIRAQTQYSLSNQRATVSPEGSYHSFSQSYEKLPPLEQLRASLKQLDSSPSKDSLVQVISAEDRIRLEDTQDYKKQPLLKYSPELRFRGVPRQAPLYRQTVK